MLTYLLPLRYARDARMLCQLYWQRARNYLFVRRCVRSVVLSVCSSLYIAWFHLGVIGVIFDGRSNNRQALRLWHHSYRRRQRCFRWSVVSTLATFDAARCGLSPYICRPVGWLACSKSWLLRQIGLYDSYSDEDSHEVCYQYSLVAWEEKGRELGMLGKEQRREFGRNV